jgi:hypothetical protein
MCRSLVAEPLVNPADPAGPCGWSKIAAAVRLRADELQGEAADLIQWAELLEGIAALEAQKG